VQEESDCCNCDFQPEERLTKYVTPGQLLAEAVCTEPTAEPASDVSLRLPDKIVSDNAVNEMFVVLINVLKIIEGLSYDAARAWSCCCN
jgi:hypothetical protein